MMRRLTVEETVLDKIVRRIVEEAHPQRVILFGSRARGTADPHSDLDLLVIHRDPVSEREMSARLRQALKSTAIGVDPRVMGEAEFEETKEVIGGVAFPAHKYGIVVYENG